MSNESGQKYSYHPEVYKRDESIGGDEQDKLHLPMASVPYSHEFYQKIIGMTLEDTERLSALDCAEKAMMLANYSMFIKRIANNEKSRIIFLKSKINSIICKSVRQYQGGWELQRAAAISDNAAAQKFNEDLVYAEQRFARLEDLHFSINNIAEKLKNLQYIKQQEK